MGKKFKTCTGERDELLTRCTAWNKSFIWSVFCNM
jgi:hypothetical protein